MITFDNSPQVIEQTLLLVYHLSKISSICKAILIESGVRASLIHISAAYSSNEYIVILSEICGEALLSFNIESHEHSDDSYSSS